jgi:hypothetical protein
MNSTIELIVDDEKFNKFLKLKRWIMMKRISLAIIHSIYTILMTILYYADIGSDILLCITYFKSSSISTNKVFNETFNTTFQNATVKINETSFIHENFVFGMITLSIIIISSIAHYIGIFNLSKREFQYRWREKEYKKFVFKVFCILFHLEMLKWYD